MKFYLPARVRLKGNFDTTIFHAPGGQALYLDSFLARNSDKAGSPITIPMAEKNNKLMKALDRYTATKDRSRRFQITIAVVATSIILFAVGRVLYLLFSLHQGG